MEQTKTIPLPEGRKRVTELKIAGESIPLDLVIDGDCCLLLRSVAPELVTGTEEFDLVPMDEETWLLWPKEPERFIKTLCTISEEPSDEQPRD